MSSESNLRYLNQLTSLRGLAAWWVVVYHFRDATGVQLGSILYSLMDIGNLAVDFFFLLSGFVINYNYGMRFTVLSSGSIFNFLKMRFARIYPLHFFILVIYLINPIAIMYASSEGELGYRYNALYYLASIFLVHNWGFSSGLAWNIPSWSISTELFAYIFFPFIAYILNRCSRGIVFQLFLYSVLSLVLIGIYKSFGYISLGQGISEIGVFRCLLQFCMGVVVSNIFRGYGKAVYSFRLGVLSFSLLISSISIYYNLPDYFFVPLVFSCVLLYFSVDPPATRSLLGRGILLIIGEVSYSTYMVHYFVKDWVKYLSHDVGLLQFFIYILIVFGVSFPLYYRLEMPWRDKISKAKLFPGAMRGR